MTSALTMYLGAPGAVVAVLALFGVLRQLYRRTLGRRRKLRAALTKLACGLTIGYVDELLGPPITRWRTKEFTHYVYRSPDSWVVVVEFEDSGTVDAFTITVRTAKLRIHTDTFTGDQLKIVLGRTKFTGVPADAVTGRRIDVGARRFAYSEAFYYGNPGRYDHYVLSHNDAGCGPIPKLSGVSSYAGATLEMPEDRELGYQPSLPDHEVRRLRENFIVNTLAVVSGEHLLDITIVLNGFSIGVDGDRVRRFPE